MSDFLHSVDPDTLLAHHQWMRRLARHLVFDEAEVDDVVQEAWLKATERPPSQPESLRAWLGTVVRNAARQLARGESRRTRREHAVARDEGLPSTAELVARAEARQKLNAATLALDEPFRSTILLRFFEGLPPREIAKRQGVPVETVRSRVRRGLAHMRTDLDRTHGGRRSSWIAALAPLAAPGIPGAMGPDGTPDAAPAPPHALPSPWAAAAATAVLSAGIVAVGGAVGWAGRASVEAEARDLAAEIATERETTDALAASAADALRQADGLAFEARRTRSEAVHRASRRMALATAMASAVSNAAPVAPPPLRSAPRFLFREHADLLGSVAWDSAGRDMAALICAVRAVAEPLYTGAEPTANALGDLQTRRGPVTELALRLAEHGMPGATPNLVLAHPAVMANLLPPTLEALGVPLTNAQETRLEVLAREAHDRWVAETEGASRSALLIRRMAIESAVLAPWMESLDDVLDDAQRDLARPPAYRGRAGLDLLSPGLLWPTGARQIPASGEDAFVDRIDAAVLAPTFPGGTEERNRARAILESWAAQLPETAFAGAAPILDGRGFAQAERLLFWAQRTADLLESLGEGAASTRTQREQLARVLGPLVPVAPIDGDTPR